MSGTIAIWIIAILTIGGVLFRPGRLPEAVFAVAGAVLLVFTGLLPWPEAGAAIGKGLDVYLFLAGMMLLSEIARREGVFDWCAAMAVAHARGSSARLYWLIYGVGVVVTTFLSNDATAVVMTPAVFAATRAAKAEKPLPYLYACALVANAASFVLPISNPANLVLFSGRMPPLAEWLRHFAVPSLVSIVGTGGIFYFLSRGELSGRVREQAAATHLSSPGRLALGGIIVSIAVLLAASAARVDLGWPTLAVGLTVLGLVAARDRKALWETPKHISWSVLPLVAGLFVVVEGVDRAGADTASAKALAALARLPAWQGNLAGAFGITAISNVVNNLPSGFIAGAAITHNHIAGPLRDSLLIGVDLGPNLSVTGSLATILWLIALRREGQEVSAWSFFKVGVIVAPLTLGATVLVSMLLEHTP